MQATTCNESKHWPIFLSKACLNCSSNTPCPLAFFSCLQQVYNTPNNESKHWQLLRNVGCNVTVFLSKSFLIRSSDAPCPITLSLDPSTGLRNPL